MLELVREPVSVVGVFAASSTIDALDGVVRIAPDEAMALGPAGRPPDVVVDDPEAVVLDVTDGWTAFAISGDRAREAFARLSALRLPDGGFVQGDVARLPARVIGEPDRVTIIVPAMWGDHLRSRILAGCADLGVTERSA